MRGKEMHGDIAAIPDGRSRTRLHGIALNRLYLSAVEVKPNRTLYFKVPQDRILVSLSLNARGHRACGRIVSRPDDVMVVGPGGKARIRTEGPGRWSVLLFPVRDFMRYSQALTGKSRSVPPRVRIWRPPSTVARLMRAMFGAAIQLADMRSSPLTRTEAAHGLEQQLIEALFQCFSRHSNAIR